jgi:predicted AlkP superfamily pyrophosphatase or phosphodiesterase
MPDQSEERLTALRAARIEGLSANDGFIYPQYTGGSILNIPGSVCNWLGVQPLAAPPLDAALTASVAGEYQRVIVLLVDALALHRLGAWMHEPEFAVWKQLAQRGVLNVLTSLTPSTTCAALTSLWTARSPAEHGTVGYELWLREYGLVANMILHAPFSFDRATATGSLRSAGFDPKTALGLPTLGTHLAAAGVRSYALQDAEIIDSDLSTMFFPDVKRVPFTSPKEGWSNLRSLLEIRTRERAFIWFYWDLLDTLSHKVGPDSEETKAAFASFTKAFETGFLNKLNSEAAKNTLFVMTADHGQVQTEKDPHYDLRNHPNFTRRLHMLPTGENRLAFLYVRPGQIEAVRETIERTWPNQFVVLESAYALESGLFGPQPHSPRSLERMGDLTVIAKGSAYWWWGNRENPLYGRHGGLTEQEMAVPFLAAPLA